MRSSGAFGNIMNECGLLLFGNLEILTSLIIDTTNLVNGKPLYYYLNEINLRPNNFTNAGQVILVSCTDSLISNLNTSYCSAGISLYYCNNNDVIGNTANYTSHNGIYLDYSDYNIVSGSILIGNTECIAEQNCQGNKFSDNGDCTYSQGDGVIPGYNLYFLLGILSFVVIILSKKVKKT